MTIVIRAVFYENNKYYPQVFLDVCIKYKNELKEIGIKNCGLIVQKSILVIVY